MNWTQFKRKWENCTSCPLHQTRKRIVLAKGTIPCDVLFVGEAPGVSEDVLGAPFVGPAGKLLDREIATAESLSGRKLRHAFTNLVCCLPLKVGVKQEPTRESIEACGDRLRDFVTLANPRLIVHVGELSATWTPKIIYKGELAGRPDVHITHPAAILRADTTRQGVMIQMDTIELADAFEELQ